MKICSGCHEVARSVSLRQDRAGWSATMTKMVTLGMKAPEKDMQAAFEYLVAHYPADEVPKLNINQAEAIDIESALSLKRSQAAAVIQYRNQNGPFKSIDDLKKVPGIDAAKIEAKKDRLTF
jgi:competence protein ComEA